MSEMVQTDIVDRLRRPILMAGIGNPFAPPIEVDDPLHVEAANEIERLRASVLAERERAALICENRAGMEAPCKTTKALRAVAIAIRSEPSGNEVTTDEA